MKLVFLSVVSLILLGFISSEIQKKVIRTKQHDIHFYVSLKSKKADKERMYYWYKSGEIHTTMGAAGGELLHSDYLKYFNDNQLAEKGVFRYGLKDGLWKAWYPQGNLKKTEDWSNGIKDGKYNDYNEKGELRISGKYRNGIKHGVWVNFEAKDTTWYEKGIAYKEPPKIVQKRMDSIAGKQPFLKRVIKPFKKIFKKKDKDKDTKE